MITKSAQRQETIRFIRLCIIGLGNFVLAVIILNTLYALTGRLVMSSTIAYVLSVLNGFVWNRLWTFHDRRGEPILKQAFKFTLVNAMGYGINFVSYTVFLAGVSACDGDSCGADRFWTVAQSILHGHAPHYSFLMLNASSVFATVVTVVWSYFAHRFWSFK